MKHGIKLSKQKEKRRGVERGKNQDIEITVQNVKERKKEKVN